jgi:hypothetical protein
LLKCGAEARSGDLDCNVTIQARVERLPNLAHSAASDPRRYFVRADVFTFRQQHSE